MSRTYTVSLSSELPVSADTVADLLAKPALMRYVLWPIITFADLPEHYDFEGGVVVRLRLMDLLPLWKHSIRIVHVDRETREFVTEEHGGPVRMWRHHISVLAVDAHRCRYSDSVEIDAGALGGTTRSIAQGLFAYRHRRWMTLATGLA